MQERPTTSSEDGDRYSYGVDADSHQRALEELVALEKEVTQARQQHVGDYHLTHYFLISTFFFLYLFAPTHFIHLHGFQ